jgi:hypothetical protein
MTTMQSNANITMGTGESALMQKEEAWKGLKVGAKCGSKGLTYRTDQD